jgi:hypothetical protein
MDRMALLLRGNMNWTTCHELFENIYENIEEPHPEIRCGSATRWTKLGTCSLTKGFQ